MPSVEERLEAVDRRNVRVESDKAWETSWTRRGLIAGITYLCAFILLNIVGHEGAWKHAFVPALGYLLSTLTLPTAKKIWLERRAK
jgi:hypothetical protein